MLLRASSEAIGAEAKLGATVGRGDSGVPAGDLLVAFAEAATRGSDSLPAVRAEQREVIGPEAFVLAAATVAIFNGLVRVADSTGIPLDDGTRNASVDFRDELGLNGYAGAGNTHFDDALKVRPEGGVAKLFGF
jgi:hypothetical protein